MRPSEWQRMIGRGINAANPFAPLVAPKPCEGGCSITKSLATCPFPVYKRGGMTYLQWLSCMDVDETQKQGNVTSVNPGPFSTPFRPDGRPVYNQDFPLLETGPPGSGYILSSEEQRLRACIKMRSGPAAADFGHGQGGELRASPKRAVSDEPTPAMVKRRAARRVFAQKAVWLRCSSLTDPPGICSLVAPRYPAFCTKTGPLFILIQALILCAKTI